MVKVQKFLFAAAVLALTTAGSVRAEDSGSITACIAASEIVPTCEFSKPEDIEVLGPLLVISEYGSLLGDKPGRIVTYEPQTGLRRALYPNADATLPATLWGDKACTQPPGNLFSPHGIHHAPGPQADRLLVVNHGGREAVEIFEIANASDPELVSLTWRGCVPMPEGTWMNDVAGLPDGGFVATHMVEKALPEEALLAAEIARSNTGWVLEWHPETGIRKLEGSDGSLPNGIEVSSDGNTVFVNEYFGDKVVAVNRNNGQRLWEASLSAPDNSSWSTNGMLLVASHAADLHAVQKCNERAMTPCALPYVVAALDPATGHTTELFAGGIDDPMGAATVAVELGDHLYLGSFVGDRMIRIPRPDALH